RTTRLRARRRSRAGGLRTPVRMGGHELLGAAQVLRRVDGEPDALVPERRELALGREVRERAQLVVAPLREALERLLVEHVDARVDPVVELRRLAEAGDHVAVAEVDDAEGRPDLGDDDGRRRSTLD